MQEYHVGQTVYFKRNKDTKNEKKIICELIGYDDDYMYIIDKSDPERKWRVEKRQWCKVLYPRLSEELPEQASRKKKKSSASRSISEKPSGNGHRKKKYKEGRARTGSEKKKGAGKSKKQHPDIYRPTDVIPGAGFTGKRGGNRSSSRNGDPAEYWEESKRKRSDDGYGVMDLPLDKRERHDRNK